MPFVTVQHDNQAPFRIFWTAEGTGPPLLLVRGLGRSHRFFAPIVAHLTDRFTVIRFDNRGAGQSDTPSGLYTTEQMAADCEAVMDAAGVGSAWILGMSMGGMIALELALMSPERVRGLVLGSVNPYGKRSTSCGIWPQLLLFISAFSPKKTARKIQAWVTLSDAFLKETGKDKADAMMDQWDQWAAMEPFRIKGLLAHTAAIFSHNSGDRLEQLNAPTLLMAGELDRLVPPANSRMMSEVIRDAELHIMPSCGHNIETERPEDMIALVRRFISEHEAAKVATPS